jgi:serine phosphatase RsbU (regulator of sigma subunit)
MHINLNFLIFGIGITTGQIADLLLVGSLSILLLRRLLMSVKTQRQMALDVKQAQEVQQVILPMRRQQVSGFAIDTEYRPAREVGGDFFQIIPNPADGSLLIVAGDVTGKGLRAGMLVALLVGAIRTAVAFDREPVRVLRELNQRLLGRGDAQATCLALRIEADGSAKLANAGHMPPYLNGRQLPMEGALPLGMVEEAEFSVMRFKLRASDRLVLLSDGIAEATDMDGKLFGFERVLDLLRTSSSAAEVADAAQKFGQEDDISVISLTRNELLSPVMA